MLAATFLTKISNLPLLAVSALAVSCKAAQLARAGNSRGISIAGSARPVRRAANGRVARVVQTYFRRFLRHGAKIQSAGRTSRSANGASPILLAGEIAENMFAPREPRGHWQPGAQGERCQRWNAARSFPALASARLCMRLPARKRPAAGGC